jgi:hypothetical protein
MWQLEKSNLMWWSKSILSIQFCPGSYTCGNFSIKFCSGFYTCRNLSFQFHPVRIPWQYSGSYTFVQVLTPAKIYLSNFVWFLHLRHFVWPPSLRHSGSYPGSYTCRNLSFQFHLVPMSWQFFSFVWFLHLWHLSALTPMAIHLLSFVWFLHQWQFARFLHPRQFVWPPSLQHSGSY